MRERAAAASLSGSHGYIAERSPEITRRRATSQATYFAASVGRMTSRWGLGALVLGLVVFTGAWLWNASTPGEGANIGAGLLIIVGAGVAVVGLITVLTTRTRGRKTNR